MYCQYATLCHPRRIDGKKVNEVEYLGKVIDKENGIYQSRSKGTFKYDLSFGYSEYKLPNIKGEELNILDFGDIYLLTETLKFTGIYSIIMET